MALVRQLKTADFYAEIEVRLYRTPALKVLMCSANAMFMVSWNFPTINRHCHKTYGVCCWLYETKVCIKGSIHKLTWFASLLLGQNEWAFNKNMSSITFFFWASCSDHCFAALDLVADVEQPFGCLIVQNRQAMQSMRRSMDWVLWGCPPTQHSIGDPPSAPHVCCSCQMNWWDVVRQVQMGVSIWGAMHLHSMDRWALSGVDVQAPWRGMLGTMWLHCEYYLDKVILCSLSNFAMLFFFPRKTTTNLSTRVFGPSQTMKILVRSVSVKSVSSLKQNKKILFFHWCTKKTRFVRIPRGWVLFLIQKYLSQIPKVIPWFILILLR